MESVAVAKSALRSKITQRLQELTSTAILFQSEEATKAILRLPQYEAAKRISVYLSMPSKELQTRKIVLDALHRNKAVFVPYIERGNPNMRMFRLRDVADYESLRADRLGIPSLAADSLSAREVGDEDLDLVVMPAVAFKRDTLERLGHGKGYYDRFLAEYERKCAGQMPLLVGLALCEQVLPSAQQIPTTPSDRSADLVITGEAEVLRPNKKQPNH